MRNTCELVVGRLIEVNCRAGFRTVADLEAIADKADLAFRRLAGEKAVIVADWRTAPVLHPPVAHAMLQASLAENPYVERSALLHSPTQATSILQLFRLVKEAAHQDRRVFTEPAELCAWLDESLSAGERLRLREFLGHKQ